MSTVLQNIAQTRQFFGWKAAFRRVASRSAQKLLRLEVNEMLWLEATALPSSIEVNSDFDFRFLTADEVAYFASDSANDLDAALADRISSGHDLCFAAIAKNGQLASYSWYALGSIEAEHHLGVAMSLPADVAYMYKAFTHPDFRGRRLYGTIVAMEWGLVAATFAVARHHGLGPPDLGQTLGNPRLSLAVTVLGLIGLAETIGLAYSPTYGVVYTFLIMVAVLAIRPQGILGRA
jgi:hypothetical protein